MADEPGTDEPVTVDEIRGWLTEAEASVDRYRRLRRRALALDADGRRALLREWGMSSLSHLDSLARIAKANVARHRAQLAALTN